MIPPELTHRPSAEEINELPLFTYDGPVRVLQSIRDWKASHAEIMSEDVVGFDTETQPTFRKGKVNDPALVQLATSKAVYLLQLGRIPFDANLASLLGSTRIVKAGVSINDDMQALARLAPFQPAAVVDLGEIAKKHGLPNHGLRTLAASVFGWRISKSSQCSNWSVRDLTPRQITYAATDAWISLQLYMRFKELGLTNG